MSEERARIGDGPIEPDFQKTMNALARGLDEIFNGERKATERKVGFVLLCFNMNETGERESRCNYISNADRADIITMFKEQIARFEGMPQQKGTA